MFSVKIRGRNLKNATIAGRFVFVEDLDVYRDVIVFKKFWSTPKPKVRVSNSSALKSVFKKLRFWDGLVWKEGHTGE